MKDFLKKYSVIIAILGALSGVALTVMHYFEQYLEQWQIGVIVIVLNLLVVLGRAVPQEGFKPKI